MVNTNSRDDEITKYYKSWTNSLAQKETPHVKHKVGSEIVLTEEEMVDFLLFIANPPNEVGVPKAYTLKKRIEKLS